jgi:hypothetical protein
MPFERSDQTDGGSAQPETVATLLRQLGVRNASGVQEADALRVWARDNVPNQALRVSFRRTATGSSSIGGLDGHRGEVPDRPSAAQAERHVRRPNLPMRLH